MKTEKCCAKKVERRSVNFNNMKDIEDKAKLPVQKVKKEKQENEVYFSKESIGVVVVILSDAALSNHSNHFARKKFSLSRYKKKNCPELKSNSL